MSRRFYSHKKVNPIVYGDKLTRLHTLWTDLLFPDIRHLQRAQLVLLQHLLWAYAEQLERDVGRLVDCKARLNFCPLGACVIAGTGLNIDRFTTYELFVFDEPLRNRRLYFM